MHVEKILELNGHSASIYTVDSLNNFIFTGSGDRFVAKWNLETGIQDKFSIRCDDAVYKIKIIPFSQQLCIGTSSGALHIIDLEKRTELKHFTAHKSALFALAFSERKKHFYAGDANGNFSVWNLETWEMLLFLPLEVGKIRWIHVSKDQSSVYLASQDGNIRQFDTSTFNELKNWFAHKEGANFITESEDGKILTAGKDAYIRIWNQDATPGLIREIPAHNYGIYQLLWMRNGENLVSISRDKSIKIWDWQRMTVLQKLERKQGGHSHSVNALCKITENRFVSVGDDKRIIFWELT